jgi:4'-phosphopantetheinyl transferase
MSLRHPYKLVGTSDLRGGKASVPATTCALYFSSLALLRGDHLRVLCPSELNRRASFRRDEDRDRFTLGAVLVRAAAGVATGTAPERLVVDRTCDRCGRAHGRPRLLEHALEVSVSHSAGHVLVAVVATTAGATHSG